MSGEAQWQSDQAIGEAAHRKWDEESRDLRKALEKRTCLCYHVAHPSGAQAWLLAGDLPELG